MNQIIYSELFQRVFSASINYLPTGREYFSKNDLDEIFFGEGVSEDKVDSILRGRMMLVSGRRSHGASLRVIQKHEDTIRLAAKKYGVPEDIAIGVGLIENGGSETAKSPAGALGVFQLMPGTARGLGLTVNSKTDERKNPLKNIDAGVRYLALNYYRFGDWGLATWAYHAGEGNVSKAIKIYAKANTNMNINNLDNEVAMRRYIDQNKITIHELLSDPDVRVFTKRLKDDSASYPYKVIAVAAFFEPKPL